MCHCANGTCARLGLHNCALFRFIFKDLILHLHRLRFMFFKISMVQINTLVRCPCQRVFLTAPPSHFMAPPQTRGQSDSGDMWHFWKCILIGPPQLCRLYSKHAEILTTKYWNLINTWLLSWHQFSSHKVFSSFFSHKEKLPSRGFNPILNQLGYSFASRS